MVNSFEKQLAVVEQDLRKVLRAARPDPKSRLPDRACAARAQLEIVQAARQQLKLQPPASLNPSEMTISLPALKQTAGKSCKLRMCWAEEDASDGGLARLGHMHGNRQRLQLHVTASDEPPPGLRRAVGKPGKTDIWRRPSSPRPETRTSQRSKPKPDIWVRPKTPQSRRRTSSCVALANLAPNFDLTARRAMA